MPVVGEKLTGHKEVLVTAMHAHQSSEIEVNRSLSIWNTFSDKLYPKTIQTKFSNIFVLLSD